MRRLLPAVLAVLAACGDAPAPAPPATAGFVPVPPPPATAEVLAARDALLAGPVARLGVSEPPILGALRATDRRLFLPPAQWPRAWEDGAVERPDGETVAAVDLTAAVLRALALRPGDRVLECGTRSGWLTALLAALAEEVFTVDSRPEAIAGARRCLELAGRLNVRFREGDPAAGWPEEGPFDAIVVNGRVPHIPRGLYETLVPGGRILAPVGDAGAPQTLILSVRGEDSPRETRPVLTVRYAPLR